MVIGILGLLNCIELLTVPAAARILQSSHHIPETVREEFIRVSRITVVGRFSLPPQEARLSRHLREVLNMGFGGSGSFGASLRHLRPCSFAFQGAAGSSCQARRQRAETPEDIGRIPGGDGPRFFKLRVSGMWGSSFDGPWSACG